MDSLGIFNRVKKFFCSKQSRIKELESEKTELSENVNELTKENKTLQTENDTLKAEFKKISDFLTEESPETATAASRK